MYDVPIFEHLAFYNFCADLPRDVLSTPMGQMLAPMIQQMTPSGTAIPFMGEPVAASDHMSSKFFLHHQIGDFIKYLGSDQFHEALR